MELRDFTIEGREDIAAFFTYLMQDLNLNFHPDNAIADYINPDNSITFTMDEADHLERILEMCFDWCYRNDADIYEIGLEALCRCADGEPYHFMNNQDEE